MGLDRSPEQLLKAGLTALKRKDYDRAIAIFQQLYQADNANSSQRVKAQMGLIQTYIAQGKHNQAYTLCHPLLKSRSQAIRQWTSDTLQQLHSTETTTEPADRSPDENADKSTDIVSNTSGFIPLNSTEHPTTTAASTSTQTSQPNAQTGQQRIEQPPTSNRNGNKSTNQRKESSTTGLPTAQPPSSLFHYQSLNSDKDLNSQVLDVDTTEQASHTHHANHIGSSKQSHTLPSDQLTQQPPAQQQPSTTNNSISPPSNWPLGSRLNTLKSLGKVSIGRLWLVQIATLPLLFFVVRWLVQITLSFMRNYISWLDRLLPLSIRLPNFFWEPHTWRVLIGLSLLTLASPWLWSWLIRPQATLTTQQLHSYSPEASQLLQRFFAKRRWRVPKIQLIASDLPLIFSYGWHPRYGQIVISQGLLNCLEADELAAVLVYELSHWSKLDWIFFSTHGLLMQGCHRTYWFLSQWGENRIPVVTAAAGTLASLSYGIFILLHWVGSGLARTRTPYRDRTATELTGNPNGLIRGLGKLSVAMAKAIEKKGYTPPLLESLDLMLPVGPDDTNVSIHDLAWSAFNPLRHWLSSNQAHPPLGDRLYILNAYGRHWRLKSSLNFAQLPLEHNSRTLSLNDWRTLLAQGGGWSGLILGLGLAMLMWLIGAISTSLDIPLLAWLYKDRSILLSMPLIGGATGHLLRINTFFPTISTSIRPNETDLARWQIDPTLIPLSSLPIKLNGTLTGRPALANWLGQEWRLRTNHGSIKLHYTHYLGPISNIQGLATLLNQPIQVTGWFRRGHKIWIDIERLYTPQNQTKFAQHPLWATIISFLTLFYGLWLIFRGG